MVDPKLIQSVSCDKRNKTFALADDSSSDREAAEGHAIELALLQLYRIVLHTKAKVSMTGKGDAGSKALEVRFKSSRLRWKWRSRPSAMRVKRSVRTGLKWTEPVSV